MRIDMNGQRALVTGGTRGIGRAIVETLTGCGAQVTATGTNRELLALLECLPSVTTLYLDLASAAPDDDVFRQLSSDRYDVIVNNAGINFHALVGEIDIGEFDRMMNVNLRGAVMLCRAVVPGMAERGYGRVVNLTSIFSEVSKTRRAGYATSKFALKGFTKTLALDYATRNVLANSIAPGFIRTEMTERMLGARGIEEMVSLVPVGRLGTPQEVATLVTFLASPLNTFVTGQNIVIDGGFTST